MTLSKEFVENHDLVLERGDRDGEISAKWVPRKDTENAKVTEVAI